MGFKLVTTAQDEFEPIIVSPTGHKRRDPVLERVAEYFARYAWEEPRDPNPTKGKNIKVSAKKIAQKCGLSQDTVNDRVEILIEMGVFTLTGWTEAGARIMDMDLEAGYRYNGFPFHPTRQKKSNREAPTEDADPTDSVGSPYLPDGEAPYLPGREALPTESGHINRLMTPLRDSPPDAASSIYNRYSSSSSSAETLTSNNDDTPITESRDEGNGRKQSSDHSFTAESLEGIKNPDPRPIEWRPKEEALEYARKKAPNINPELVITRFWLWCLDKKIEPTNQEWIKWMTRDQERYERETAEADRKTAAEQRESKPWYEKELRF